MEAIVLAAGYSSRANAFKMTLRLGQMSVLEHTISKFEEICSKVIVVAGFQAEAINEEINKINDIKAYTFQIKVVYNENFDLGMFSSIQKGCTEIDAPAFFITPGDCPLVNKLTLKQLADRHGKVVIPSFQFKGGHPIKLSKLVSKKILAANPESNLRDVLNSYDKTYFSVDDPGVLMDVDTEEDYQKAIAYYTQYYGDRSLGPRYTK